jgi:hypothetical protein
MLNGDFVLLAAHAPDTALYQRFPRAFSIRATANLFEIKSARKAKIDQIVV